MVLSGGDDDAHGNQTVLEHYLNSNMADWEISRYSGVDHGFTSWESDAYNLNADVRSWTAMMNAMKEVMAVPVPVEEKDDEMDGSDAGSLGVLAAGLGAVLSLALF